MNDTVNKNMLTGNYCFYNELTGNAIATQRAVAIDYSQGDSLFMHGDTLRLVTYHMNTDSAYREMRVYHKVRAYRTDVQAVCDSLVYNSKDSCLTMYTDPVLWHGAQQLLGEEVKVYMNDSTIDWAHIINQALAVEQKDSIHYNQVTGKEMKAFFQNGDMRRVDVNGNVLIVFYPEEKDSTMIGMNYAEGSFLRIYLKDRKMEEAALIGKSNGILYPMDQIPADKMKLPSFVWFDYIRPLNKDDIFEWRGKKAGETLQKSDRKPLTSPRDMHIKRTKNNAMGMFAMRKPRGFHHSYIYVDERKEKLAKMEEDAKRELGMLPEKEFSPEDIRGKFIEGTTHLKRRKESGRRPVHLGVILVVVALLIYLWYAITNGII